MSEIAEFTRHLGHYLQPPDVALVERAFHFSDSAHRGQFRKSGEPYITHPLAVASILSQWRLDAQGLAAALLHDVMEDTTVTKGEIETSFGKPVADMVDGVSKLDQIEFTSREEAQAESFRKMLLAMAQDVRVILIKLADRLHNMRTLDAMAPAHRRRIARETLDIYAPIANRLGLNALYLELQDLAFKHLYPMRFRVLAGSIKAARGNRREVMNRLLDVIRDGLAKADIHASVSGREKTIYSVYKKMREKRYTFSQVFDIYGVRVLVPDETASYVPRGATAVDFAYGVHTDIGHHCVAARINYEQMPLRTELKNGDQIEILTSPTARPNPSWLSFVATGKARSRIRHFLKGLQQKESAALGERMLSQALATFKVEPESISWDRWEALQKEFGSKSQLEILADIGIGKRLSFAVAQALTRPAGKEEAVPAAPAKPSALSLRGVEGVAIQYGKCCRPVPGDSIVGQFRKGQGLVVHTRDCVTLKKQRVDPEQLIDVEWSPDVHGVFDAGIRLLVADRRGLLADLATAISNADANIDNVSLERPDGGEVLAMFFSVQVRDRRHLANVMRGLKRVPDVKRIYRART